MNDIMEADWDVTEEPTQIGRNEAEYQPVADTSEGTAFHLQLLEQLEAIRIHQNTEQLISNVTDLIEM